MRLQNKAGAARRACAGILVAGAAAAASPAFAQAPVLMKENGVENRFIVVFEESLDVSSMMSKMTALTGAEPKFQYERALRGGSFVMNETQARMGATMPGVAFIEQVTEVRPTAAVSEPNADYGLDNLTADRGYSSRFDGTGVNVYVIDSGIADNNGFGNRVKLLDDLVGDGMNGGDCMGHGTRVAGLVAGDGTGPAQGASLFAERIFGCDGGTTNDILIMGFENIIKDATSNPQPDILQGSLSGDGSEASDMAIRNVIAAGITAVISAGNDGRDACLNSPGRAEGVINVGATDFNNQVAFFSNRGRCVSLYAGGVGVISLSNRGGNSREAGTGTSFSAPLVAGAAAVIIQEAAEAGQKLTPAQVKQALLQRATQGVVRAIPALPDAENRFARVR